MGQCRIHGSHCEPPEVQMLLSAIKITDVLKLEPDAKE